MSVLICWETILLQFGLSPWEAHLDGYGSPSKGSKLGWIWIKTQKPEGLCKFIYIDEVWNTGRRVLEELVFSWDLRTSSVWLCQKCCENIHAQGIGRSHVSWNSQVQSCVKCFIDLKTSGSLPLKLQWDSVCLSIPLRWWWKARHRMKLYCCDTFMQPSSWISLFFPFLNYFQDLAQRKVRVDWIQVHR